jgi:hypothetical protein
MLIYLVQSLFNARHSRRKTFVPLRKSTQEWVPERGLLQSALLGIGGLSTNVTTR